MNGPIVGIGELLWDIYPDGRKVAGGAPFNFAFHCHQLGHEAVIVSRIGDDDLGKELREAVKRAGMSDEFIQTDFEHPTGTVRVTVDDNNQPSYEIAEGVAWDFIEHGENWRLGDVASAVCHGTLALRAHLTRRMAMRLVNGSRYGQAESIRIFDVNLRNSTISTSYFREAITHADWVKVNEAENATIAEWLSVSPSKLPAWHRRLAATPITPPFWMVTKGAQGVDLAWDNEFHHEPAAPARVIDTVGAGDAFTAAMVCLHLEGRPLRECARFANYYAAKVCEHVGATPTIDRAAVERATFG
jgi:fructokinase